MENAAAKGVLNKVTTIAKGGYRVVMDYPESEAEEIKKLFGLTGQQIVIQTAYVVLPPEVLGSKSE